MTYGKLISLAKELRQDVFNYFVKKGEAHLG